ncbi:uncharacterized protein N7482_007853 [Penicillium canariense]|uniref:Uncharacterized protein n=1 Tax=Penicillium canariense TaxID=189055 RepID=A0A9W9LKJ6_9EURO|nr:uncharacterized protein N7482_007853 [Penicillium canariense]KAJ5160849.1 hypothetical protein N7482_007853 [Penicillium canariense]
MARLIQAERAKAKADSVDHSHCPCAGGSTLAETIEDDLISRRSKAPPAVATIAMEQYHPESTTTEVLRYCGTGQVWLASAVSFRHLRLRCRPPLVDLTSSYYRVRRPNRLEPLHPRRIGIRDVH